jgi:hypothetical protein
MHVFRYQEGLFLRTGSDFILKGQLTGAVIQRGCWWLELAQQEKQLDTLLQPIGAKSSADLMAF